MAQFDIEIRNIEVKRPDGTLLFRIGQADVPWGKKVLITGESGKGKTTFLHLLAGLFTADSGAIHYGDVHFSELSDGERAHFRRQNIGVIFQKLNIIDHLTVKENVLLGISAEGPEARAEMALEKVGLSSLFQNQCSHLSLGEQQRVAAARVLAQETSIVLADEPTSSLDDKNSALVMRSLFAATEGKTLLVVSHDHRLRDHFDQVLSFEELTR